ncbi:MAG: VacJ family lipoprotein [Pseudomonadota bacterium]
MKNPISILFLSVLLVGCSSARNPDGTIIGNPDDPLEGMNRKLYSFNKTLDDAVLKPVTKGYQKITPNFMQRGISNFFNNLRLLPSIVNGIFQFDGHGVTMNTGRLIMNSTLGVGGILDLATPSGLDPHYNDFGQTLAVWGVRQSSYLMIPFYGPSTIRDGVGIFVDRSFLSVWPYIESDRLYWGLTVLNMVDTRSKQLKNEGAMKAAALDEYAFIRDAYLQYRAHQINRALGKDTDDLDEDSSDFDLVGDTVEEGDAKVKVETKPQALPKVSPQMQPAAVK